MPRCPTCLESTAAAVGHCRACGETLTPPCAGCGRARGPGCRVCAGCGEGLPAAELAPGVRPGPAGLRVPGALAHPREVAAFAELLEQVSLRPAPTHTRSRPPAEVGPVIPVPAGPAAHLAAELGVAPGIRRVACGPVHLRGDQLEIGRNLACALDASELSFLVLSELYPRRLGLDPGALLRGDARGRRAWERYLPRLALSADRFAWVLAGVPLPQAARARFKAAGLGGARPLSGVLERLGQFHPGEDFRAYRELFEPLPGELERIWELVAFARSEDGQAWQALAREERVERDQRREHEERQEPDATRKPLQPRVTLVEAARVAARERPSPAPRSRRTKLRVLRPSGPGEESPPASLPETPDILVLSAYHADLRFSSEGRVRRLDLGEHLRMPTRIAAVPGGGLWVADGETGRLLRLDGRGRPAARLDGGPRRPGPMEADEAGRLWVADGQAGRVRVLDAKGQEVRELGGAVNPGLLSIGGMARDPSGGLWVSDTRGRRLVWLDPEGAPRRMFPTTRMAGGVERPGALVADGEGGVWLVDEASGRLLRIGPAGGVREVRAPAATTSLLGARLKRRSGGGLLLLDGPRARLVGWDAAGRLVDALPDLVAPEDRHGYAADLEVGPSLGVPSAGVEGRAAPAVLAPTGT